MGWMYPLFKMISNYYLFTQLNNYLYDIILFNENTNDIF